jgi:pimeloyl-ACP methyl ester carboxylesterase
MKINPFTVLNQLTKPWDPPRESGPGSPIAAHALQSTFFTADGAEIYFEDTEGDGPVLFFLYGLGCHISHWKHQMAYFLVRKLEARTGEGPAGGAGEAKKSSGKKSAISAARRVASRSTEIEKDPIEKNSVRDYRIVWLDYRGHGNSSPWHHKSPLTFDVIIDDIRDFCAHRQIHEATFLGQSLGGTFALKLSAKFPSLVKSIILQGSPPVGASSTIAGGVAAKAVFHSLIRLNENSPGSVRAMYRASQFLRSPILEIIRFAGFNQKLASVYDIDEYVEHLLASDPNVFWDLAKDLEKFNVADISPPISCPALIIAGAHDALVPLDQISLLAHHLPRSELKVINHGSHCPHFDDPFLVSQLIDEFISNHL